MCLPEAKEGEGWERFREEGVANSGGTAERVSR